jgi:hypothetical protein
MSYQRAVVNCRRCYGIADYILRNYEKTVAKFQTLNNQELWVTRNEAMQALEDEFKRNTISSSNIRAALTACMNCEYKKAEIAELLDSSDGSV